MRQPLRFREVTLAPAQSFFRLLAFRDIVEKDGDFSVPWFSHTESISVVPTVQFCRFLFKAYGLAGQGYPAVNFKPVLFMLRSNLAHSFASRILNACLFLKRWIDLQEAVIIRITVFVE